MKYLITLLFVLISTQLWAAEDKQTYFCLSASDGSQKLLVLADVNGEQVGYLDTDEYKLNDENGVLVGPSNEGSRFFKLASGKLDLMSSEGMWSGVCHKFTSGNAQALSNASKTGEIAVDTEVGDSSQTLNSSNPITCEKNPEKCTKIELCKKATFSYYDGTKKWRLIPANKPFAEEAKSRGLSCGVKTESSSSSSGSSSNNSEVKLSACPSSGYFDNCYGTYTWPSGQKYVGAFENGRKNGQGTYTYADGRKHVGAFENGKLNGYAITYYADGNIDQEGIFKDDKFLYAQPACPPPIGKIGNVKITDPIKHNCFGIDKDANGNTYEGGWYFGKKHGQGTYTYAEGDKYVGEWKNGDRHGQGTYTFANGDKYVGEWKDHNIHGQGTYTLSNGVKEEGAFENGYLNGYGTIYEIDGSIYQQGIFKNGKFLHAQKKNKVVPQVELLAQIMEGKRPEWTKKQVKCFAKEMKKGLDKNLFDQFVSMMKKEKGSIDDVGVLMAVMPISIGVAAKCGIPMDLNNMLEDN